MGAGPLDDSLFYLKNKDLSSLLILLQSFVTNLWLLSWAFPALYPETSVLSGFPGSEIACAALNFVYPLLGLPPALFFPTLKFRNHIKLSPYASSFLITTWVSSFSFPLRLFLSVQIFPPCTQHPLPLGPLFLFWRRPFLHWWNRKQNKSHYLGTWWQEKSIFME